MRKVLIAFALAGMALAAPAAAGWPPGAAVQAVADEAITEVAPDLVQTAAVDEVAATDNFVGAKIELATAGWGFDDLKTMIRPLGAPSYRIHVDPGRVPIA